MNRLLTILTFIVAANTAVPATAGQPITVPGFSAAEAASADQIAIVGPAAIAAGQTADFRITGTPPVNLTLPLFDQIPWLNGDARLYCYLAETDRPLLPVSVRADLVFGHTGATLEPFLRVLCTRPGQARILVDWNFGQHQLAEHRFQITNDINPPDPPVPPDPEPDPGGKWQILIFHESTDLPQTPFQQLILLSSSALRDQLAQKGHVLLGIFDKDSFASDDSKGRYTAWWNAIAGATLPRIAIANLDGGIINHYPLPADQAAFWTLLEKPQP